MTGTALSENDSQIFHFSTDAFRKHERVAAWREVFGRTVLKIDIAPKSAEDFRASAAISRFPNLGLVRASTSAVQQGNSRRLISSDDVSFGVVMNSRWGASQLGRSMELYPGDGMLMSNGDVGSLIFPDECRYLAFGLPKSALTALVPDVGALFARRVPATNRALRLLLRYLELVQDEHPMTAPELQTAFVNHVCDLLALAVGATRDATELAKTRSVSAARLSAMKDDIRKTLNNSNLSVHDIAARYGVSARYVQRIFEDSGFTFTQYVTEQRLEAAYKALRHRASAGVPISTIAYDCGFADISHFNRVFRQRFGCTPSDVRNAARPGDE
jgi:AraC-like DNA-binding protein